MESTINGAALYTSVPAYLLEHAPSMHVALFSQNTRHTYAELSQGAQLVAMHLLSLGLHAGDRVLLCAPNSFFWAASYLGILQAGLVCVPVAPSLPAPELEEILRSTEAHAACVQSSAARTHSALRVLPVLIDMGPKLPGFADCVDFPGLQTDPPEARVLPTVKPSDLAALLFTSGSTAKPRGVMISHENIIANTESILASLGICSSDRMMTVLPFHYCFGLSLLHTHLRVGASLVLDNRFLFPEKVLDRMQETHCTGFAGVPSHYQILLRKSTFATRQFPALRLVQQAGGHLPPEFVRELREALPKAKVFVMYGQTEATARLSCLPPEKLETKPGSIGRGIPGVRLRVLHDGREAAPGEVGEILAEGANIARGYWKDEAATAAIFENGRLHTGDLATVDADGDIFIVGRISDFLKCGGVRLSCALLEESLMSFPGVVEAAVLGVPDELMGEAVELFVVSTARHEGFESELREHCRRHFPTVAQPRGVHLLDALPKNSAGKTDKASLRTLLPKAL